MPERMPEPYDRGWWDGPFATEDELITECPCDCGCTELTEDGGVCIVCRTGIHNADQE